MEKTSQMTQEEIQSILKEIKYPGFNRDIVSFGMVKNISLNENIIDISLQINSENEDLLNQLTSEIKNKFLSLNESNVNIIIQKPQNQPAQSACLKTIFASFSENNARFSSSWNSSPPLHSLFFKI